MKPNGTKRQSNTCLDWMNMPFSIAALKVTVHRSERFSELVCRTFELRIEFFFPPLFVTYFLLCSNIIKCFYLQIVVIRLPTDNMES